MGTNSISFSLGGNAKGAPAGRVGFGIRAPKKVAPISAVFAVDDSDTEDQEVVDHSAKRRRVESSGSYLAGLTLFYGTCRSVKLLESVARYGGTATPDKQANKTGSTYNFAAESAHSFSGRYDLFVVG